LKNERDIAKTLNPSFFMAHPLAVTDKEIPDTATQTPHIQLRYCHTLSRNITSSLLIIYNEQ